MSILRNRVTFSASLLFLAFFSMASIAPARASAAKVNPYLRLLKSTALVQSSCASGTAWVYDREHGLLVTNYHVVEDLATGELYDKVAVTFPVYHGGRPVTEQTYYEANEDELRANGHLVEAQVVDAQESVDLALLKVKRLPDEVVAVPLATESPMSNDQLLSIGNSDDQAYWLSTTGRVKVVSQRLWRVSLGKRLLHLDACAVLTEAPTNHGDSGGPVVNEAGELVCVTEGNNPSASLQNYAIDVSEVRAYLAGSAWLAKPNTSADYARRARHYFADPTFEQLPPRNRRVALALADVREAIRLDPKNPDYYLERARIIEQNVRYVAGAKVRPSGSQPGSPSRSSLDLRAAKEDVRHALDLAPNNARAWARLGSLSHTLEDKDRIAIEQLQKAVELDPDCVEAYQELVAIHRIGNVRRAVLCLDEILRVNPNNPAALAVRGDIQAVRKNYDAALRDYGRAVRLCPKQSQYYRCRAAIYKAMLKTDAAFRDMLTVATKIEPDNAGNWRDLGDLLADNGKPVPAATAYTQALELIAKFNFEDCSAETLYFARGKARLAAGATEEARQDFQSALKIVQVNRPANPQFERKVRTALDGLNATAAN